MATDNNANAAGYVCTLSPELIKKAETELNEKAKWRNRDIQALKELVLKQAGLHSRTDDAFLLRFLRARKFDYEQALNLIVSYYRAQADNKDMLGQLVPSSVKHILDAGVVGVLPHRDREGRKVLVLRPGRWNPDKYPMTDMFKTMFLTLCKVIEDEETQINGVIIFVDFFELTWSHARHLSPSFARVFYAIMQEAFPMRLKAIHYINEPSFFGMLFSIVKVFMKEKLVKRLHFHGANVAELSEFVDHAHLPEEYGGEEPKYSTKEWMDIMLASEEQFVNELKYCIEELQAAHSTNKQDAMECLVGSYKKIDI